MTIRAIPVVGIRPVGQEVKGGLEVKGDLEVQEAQEAQDVVDAGKDEDPIYLQALVATELSRHALLNCIRPNVHRIKSWPITEA